MVTKEQLDHYLKMYQQGTPEISDEEYDRILEEYLQVHGESQRPFTRNKQSAAVNDIVGTLPKVYGVTEPMRPGQKVYKDWIKNLSPDDMIVVQPKFDGCSVADDLQLDKMFTRGDYDNGESVDVTDIMDRYLGHYNTRVNSAGDRVHLIAVKYEAIVSHEQFEYTKINEKYRRPRDVVAATITSRKKWGHPGDMVDMVPLRLYWEDGAQTLPPNMKKVSIVTKAGDFETIENFISDKLKSGATTKFTNWHDFEADWDGTYSIDGVVVSKVKEIEKNGRIVIDPEHEVAIKILNMVESTKLLNIEWQFGRSGRITPVAIVEPVMFGNITVDHIGLSTFERVASMNLRYGDTVRIVYNIVPYFLDSQHDGTLPIPIPNKCPKCGAPLDMRTLRQIQCTNPNCDGRKLGSIIRYCEKMKMFGVSEGIITKLWDNGYVKDISDLYTMDLMEAAEIDGLGEKSMSNVIKSIDASSHGIPVHRWLGALPCNAVSDKTWKTILKSVYGEHHDGTMQADIARMCYEDTPDEFLGKMLWYTHGIGNATIASINEGIRNSWETIKTIIHYITFDKGGSNGGRKGVVCLSGTRDATLTSELQRRGYEVSDAFNKKCIAVVIPNPTFTSSKVDKARNVGIPVYTMNEVLNDGAL